MQRASACDVALPDVFATSVNGIAHAFALASAEGVEPEDFADTATSHGIDAGMLTAAKRTIDRAVADGYGPEGPARMTTVLTGGYPAARRPRR